MGSRDGRRARANTFPINLQCTAVKHLRIARQHLLDLAVRNDILVLIVRCLLRSWLRGIEPAQAKNTM